MGGARRRMASLKSRFNGILLFLLPVPLIFKTLFALWGGELWTVLANAIPCVMLYLGASIMRRGLVNEERYLERPLAMTPPPPLKAIAAAIIGCGTAVASYFAAAHPFLIGVLFGMGATGGVLLYYGLDPKKKTMEAGEHGIGLDELSAALTAAYAKLDGINEARNQLRSREFQERLDLIVGESENILKEIERDPRDLRRARKFLNVYLDGVLGVTRNYINAQDKSPTPAMEQNYRALLIDMETVCREQHEKLLQNDVFDLDVQMEVLSTRLKREGVV
ncbi:MAG: 5-bromo-4-chloroindolyl phosphate hydrolysis family protein [Hyphomicrobiales bacterium]|nr:5-bromo-4-chloroindolyl phosphate hydrolysis family protein [Hyphomicrobiales bacterium]